MNEFRRPPPEESVTEPAVKVAIASKACPSCGDDLRAVGTEKNWITDVPRLIYVTRAYDVEVCECVGCGKRVRGRHPDLSPDQTGATAHRVGTRTYALAHLLRYGLGISECKVSRTLELLLGISLTQSALNQDASKRADGLVGEAYAALRAGIERSPTVHTDDTGWRIGGEPAWAMVFETHDTVVYQIRERHTNEEVREVVPEDYAGVLETDRGKSYDAREMANIRKQKCVAHVQRNLSELLERKQGRARAFAEDLKTILRAAVKLWQEYREGRWSDQGAYDVNARALIGTVTRMLRERRMRDPDNDRMRRGLARHHDQGSLLRFLLEPDVVEPTNNRAERAIRGCVTARKVSQCSKNSRGAETYGAMLSVVQTVLRRGFSDPVETIAEVFRTGVVPPRPTRAPT